MNKIVPYTHLEWIHQKLWPRTAHGFPVSKGDDTPVTTGFTVAPYMLLQNGEPPILVNSLANLRQQGQHFYDQQRIITEKPFGQGHNFNSLTSTIEISKNMFVQNKSLFNGKLLKESGKGKISINNNLFFGNRVFTSENEYLEIPRYNI